MGRIIAEVEIQNLQSKTTLLKIKAFVDTAAAYLTLPTAWKDKLGSLQHIRTVTAQLADQRQNQAEIFGPVLLQIKGFQQVISEVLFLNMTADDQGEYEALLGYIPLEQANAAVDMSGHRLVPLKYVDMK